MQSRSYCGLYAELNFNKCYFWLVVKEKFFGELRQVGTKGQGPLIPVNTNCETVCKSYKYIPALCVYSATHLAGVVAFHS